MRPSQALNELQWSMSSNNGAHCIPDLNYSKANTAGGLLHRNRLKPGWISDILAAFIEGLR